MFFRKKKEKIKKNYIKLEIEGYECYIVEVFQDFLCGYIKINANNPYYLKHYDCLNWGKTAIDIETEWTYSGPYIPKCSEAGEGWFIGFDCAHADDICIYRNQFVSFRTQEYLENQFLSAIRIMEMNKDLTWKED